MGRLLAIARTGFESLLLHPLRSLVTVAAVTVLLTPYLSALAISQGIQAEAEASIRSGAQEVRLARVRVRTLSPSRKDSRKRMAGGEFRLGTAVIYMSVYIT